MGIHEVLMPDDDLRDAILRRAPARGLRRIARGIPGFLTLQESGLLKAMAGQTTLDEIAANAPRDAAMRKPAELKAAVGGGSALWPQRPARLLP
jgi:type IV pilus assembly protein PilB